MLCTAAVLLAPGAACNAPPAPAAQARGAPTDTPEARVVTEPRFLIVTLHRIQIIDWHPGAADEAPTNATTPRYAIPSYAARPPAQRPEIHTYDQVLAVPELAPATFELTLDREHDYRMLFVTRGWSVLTDGKIHVDGQLTTSWAVQHAGGGAEGPNPSNLSPIALALDAWRGFDVMRARDQRFVYTELQEVRVGPITTKPPAEAVRGAPDTLGAQHKKELDWMTAARKVVVE